MRHSSWRMDEDRVVLIGGWWKPTFTHLIIDQHAVIASRLDNAPEANNQYSDKIYLYAFIFNFLVDFFSIVEMVNQEVFNLNDHPSM